MDSDKRHINHMTDGLSMTCSDTGSCCCRMTAAAAALTSSRVVTTTGIHVRPHSRRFRRPCSLRTEGTKTSKHSRPFFFIVHAGLHVLYVRHARNEFTGAFSWVIILGAAIAGLVDWLMRM